MFERYVSIDWSGAGVEHEWLDLRVAEAVPPQPARIVAPPGARAGVRSWSLADVADYLAGLLRPGRPRTLVAMAFGFGLPWGADRAVFGCTRWRPTLNAVAARYLQSGTARVTAEAIKADPRFGGHGPYRFDEGRTDRHFYNDRAVAYYRLVEVAIPQAISQWYVGSGGTVGFHTITGLAALAGLLARRDAGELSFAVWPQLVQPDRLAPTAPRGGRRPFSCPYFQPKPSRPSPTLSPAVSAPGGTSRRPSASTAATGSSAPPRADR
jgi:hypothetical protein